MKKSFTALSLTALVLFGSTSCKKTNTDATPTYTIPTTYNFANANFADATTRLGEITEMTTLMKNATTGVISATNLKNMFANTGSPFATAAYNTSGIQPKDQGATLYQTDALSFIDSLVKVSTSTTVASRGVAGVGASSATPTSKYALTVTGVNYAQVFTKSTMTGLVTYQITTIMSNMAKLAYDNTANVNGETTMEHSWDMAFGYWGVPIDFPTNKTGVKLWGSYTTQVDSGYKANKILMNAFLAGRAAISNKDNSNIIIQANIIMQAMEKLSAAAALQEVNEIKASISDNIARNSRLSECYGFIYSIKYNPYKTALTDTQVNAILALFPKNFYDLTSTDIANIQAAIAKPYGFVSVQDIL